MPALPVDEDEADALLLGVCRASRWGDPMTAFAAERAILRVEHAEPLADATGLSRRVLAARDGATIMDRTL